MIKAIFWDFGGVLTTSPFIAFNHYEAQHGIPLDTIRMINASNPDQNAWARFERNEINLDAFDRDFATEAQMFGYTIPGRDVFALLYGELIPEMVKALQYWRKYFKTACLTNNMRTGNGNAMPCSMRQTEKFNQVMTNFDFVIESSKIGFRKPDPKFYQIACQQVEVAPHEVVFLDDLGINLKPARAMGMKTIKVLNPRQALLELQSILDAPPGHSP